MIDGPILADPTLGMCADIVDDLEAVRCANENRLRTLTTPAGQLDKDGKTRGHGLTLDHPDVLRLAELVGDLQAAEHRAVLNLQRVMRHHPLGPWVKATSGVGEKQAARLLGQIRDPWWNDLHDRPRTLRELWAYCGFHVLHSGVHAVYDSQGSTGAGVDQAGDTGVQTTDDDHRAPGAGVAPKRQRGQQSNWDEEARKRVWLIAESCVKTMNSPYREVYDKTRLKYAEAVHTSPCARCGPKGKPAAIGTPISAGHQHARAMRAMGKEMLRDLWREARRLHGADD